MVFQAGPTVFKKCEDPLSEVLPSATTKAANKAVLGTLKEPKGHHGMVIFAIIWLM